MQLSEQPHPSFPLQIGVTLQWGRLRLRQAEAEVKVLARSKKQFKVTSRKGNPGQNTVSKV